MSNYRWPPQKRLKLLLVERGLTSTWLSETTGVSLVTITGVLSGRVRPTPRVRALIADALGEPAGTLFEHVDDPTAEEVSAVLVEPWETMPALDDETVDRLRRLLFPQHARVVAGGRADASA